MSDDIRESGGETIEMDEVTSEPVAPFRSNLVKFYRDKFRGWRYKKFGAPSVGDLPLVAQDEIVGDLAAIWPVSTVRYFSVDYDNGSDANDGFSDVSMAVAGTKAIKTLEHLKAIFPKFGNGRKAVVVVKARAGGATYRNIADTADDDLDFLIDVYGYEHLLVRATDTIPTAGSTAFANDLADKTACGGRISPGTNVAGYNPAGVPTTSVFDCVLAGGGAPGLSAEPALIGKRIRFDAATTTVALRNICRMIWQNDTDTITVGVDLPAVPVATDVFYIEEPGVAVNRIIGKSSNPNNIAAPPSFASQGIVVAGIRTVNVGTSILLRGATAFFGISFCQTPAAALLGVNLGGGNFQLQPSYSDELPTPTTINVGTSLRTDGLTASGMLTFGASSFACVGFRPQILNVAQLTVGSGSYSFAGALFQGCGLGGISAGSTTNALLGNNGTATTRRLRVVSPFAGTQISVGFSNVLMRGIDMTGAGTASLISVTGLGVALSIRDVVGSTGNTGVGLQLSGARDCNILMGTLAANTFTGAAGQDVAGGGPVFYVHADYARTDLVDANGNHIQGTGLSIVGPSALATNNAVAAIGQYAVCRATGSGVVQAAQADSAANAAGVVGVSQSPATAAPVQSSMLANGGGTWVQFDAAPTAGGIAYLSTLTAGNAQDTVPALAGTNRKLRLGRILRVSGTLGFVSWSPEVLSVLADGLA